MFKINTLSDNTDAMSLIDHNKREDLTLGENSIDDFKIDDN